MNVERPLCGTCNLFDPNGVNGEPVGISIADDGSIVKKGFCRGPFGLTFSMGLTEKSPCRQQDDIYISKEPVAAAT